MQRIISVVTGEETNLPSLPPNPEILTERDYMSKAQYVMDAKAQSMGYDNIFTAVSYVGDSFKRFNDEAVALREYRSKVWQHSNKLMEDVLSGKTKQPTIEKYVKGLPEFKS